jgi:hypothetical protein
MLSPAAVGAGVVARPYLAESKKHMSIENSDVERISPALDEVESGDRCCSIGDNGKWGGNNAYPYPYPGRCCNDCNQAMVIPARARGLKPVTKVRDPGIFVHADGMISLTRKIARALHDEGVIELLGNGTYRLTKLGEIIAPELG